ncbi:MAG: chemotaxis protein CheD [Gammaproteobacteria bacterium]|nr:chemotaxis protein CheD [Gammaproteobacteria bacterium]
MSEIFLLPGEFYFGDQHKKIKTLLGSCVAITMWNKRLKIGGMCHFKLPRRHVDSKTRLDGSYGDESMLLFMKSLSQYGLRPANMVVGVFGAGDMFLSLSENNDKSIGKQNIRLAFQLLDKLGFGITHESLGGYVSRRIALDIETGVVKVQSLDIEQQKWL